MICCEKCFNDIEIKNIIKGLAQKGNCELCGKRNVYIFNTDVNDKLAEMFDDLLNIYTAARYLPSDYPREQISLLKDELCKRWNLFNIDSDLVYKAITNICKERYKEQPEIFDEPIGIREINQEEYLKKYSIIKNFQWENFVEDIKTKNRFHLDYMNEEVLYNFFNSIIKEYKQGSVFYRARISTSESGFIAKEMGAPPIGTASAGRANPEGISYLYLADEVQTALSEIRAGAYDYVTVGKFVLKHAIKVVDLTIVDRISPFWDLDKTVYAVNKKNLQKISEEIAKPVRRHDSHLDYLPTQYISDFIKSKGFDGIEYKSTMKKEGYNLAVFNESLFECESVQVVDIREISYDYESL